MALPATVGLRAKANDPTQKRPPGRPKRKVEVPFVPMYRVDCYMTPDGDEVRFVRREAHEAYQYAHRVVVNRRHIGDLAHGVRPDREIARWWLAKYHHQFGKLTLECPHEPLSSPPHEPEQPAGEGHYDNADSRDIP